VYECVYVSVCVPWPALNIFNSPLLKPHILTLVPCQNLLPITWCLAERLASLERGQPYFLGMQGKVCVCAHVCVCVCVCACVCVCVCVCDRTYDVLPANSIPHLQFMYVCTCGPVKSYVQPLLWAMVCVGGPWRVYVCMCVYVCVCV